jgi:hypothetical protein
MAGGASGIRGTRAEGRREGKDDRGSRGDNRAQRKVFENTRDLASDLLGAKNAGVTGRV